MNSDMPGDSPAATNLIQFEDKKRGGRGGGGVTTELRELPLSDVWSGKWFADHWKKTTRYSYELDEWIIYRKGRWAVDIWGERDRRILASVEALQTAPRNHVLLLGKDQKDVNEYYYKCLASRTLAAIVARAKSECAVTLDEFDTDGMLLPLQNGTINLNTGELRDPKPEDMCMKQCPVDFEKDAVPNKWIAGLEVWQAGDKKMVSYLRRLVASFLTADVGDEAFFVLLGPPRTGKGTFVSTIEALLGPDYAFPMPVEYFLQTRNPPLPIDVHAAWGKRLVTVSENERNARFNNEKVKKWTGGDALAGKGMRENLSSRLPTHKLLLQTNHAPKFDLSISQRLKTIGFLVQLSEESRDPHLKKYLRDNELPGILNWALGPVRGEELKEGELVGLADWRVNRLNTPEAVKLATKDLLEAQDELREFFEDRCEFDSSYQLEREEGYKAYRAWCDENRERHPFGKKAFIAAMREQQNIQEGVSGSKRWRGWYGLRLLPGVSPSGNLCEVCPRRSVGDGRCAEHPRGDGQQNGGLFG